MTDIDAMLVEQPEPHYTQPRPILSGSFNISRAAIPFFQTTMTLDDVVKNLELVENLPSDLRQRWRLEELFQREIDWKRVDEEIVTGYLRRPEKLQFFNSLTVALLPVDEKQHLQPAYGEPARAPTPKDAHTRAPWVVRNIGGVELTTADSTPHGVIRWDPKRIFAATIDGQHRLAALKRFHERGNLSAKTLQTTVSVILLVLDPRAGLEIAGSHQSPDDNAILSVVREIFIDLNRTSRGVVRARQILLDDQEIESRCVRRLMAERVGEREPEVLPLGLVHWQHKVTAKFNAGDSTGPFITTVELLHAIVKDILHVRPPQDPLDEREVRMFVERVEDALRVSEIVVANPARYHNQPSLMTYVERNHVSGNVEKPFSNLPGHYLRAADEGFIKIWRKPIVRVLTEFAPYRNFIAEVDKRGGIDGELAFYLCLPARAQQQMAEEWRELRHEKIDDPLRELASMKLSDWAFYAVFQKGLMRATASALKHAEVVLGKTGANLDVALDAWLEFLNTLHARGVFAVKSTMPAEAETKAGCDGAIWSGIAVNPGAKTVKWSESTVNRISSMLLIWWYFYAQNRSSVSSFLKASKRKDANQKLPEVASALKALLPGVKSGAIARTSDDLAPAEVEARTSRRLDTIIALARNDKAAEQPEDTSADDDLGPDDASTDEAPVELESEERPE